MIRDISAKHSKGDKFVWLLVAALVAGGVWANLHFAQQALVYRLSAGLGILAVAVLLSLQTYHGQIAFSFVKAARTELRKVIWPNRQETMRMTFVVIAAIVIMSLALWGIDSLLFLALASITG